ncbi:lipid IV(A) 3-deoxy-D-manno-octulosonic acid transferase [Candidatus Methylobacter oryzae]|uniref:3-deoxy-D-manno-octulosonic acid transferase n=1 Tax=Candidatus Methylobacter oryzae TaxID=2497749 RepID=A0ABY3C787_9GAMM|nr:lipid IV(A) 3-deoxy-D-manno-octulosonic acid transferase [Candidatus Methylobacter oryzae]TRW90876.1 3-deoxy-D-manno-octulosonic acid transferase [Candidatus Methylobacter oryzae]
MRVIYSCFFYLLIPFIMVRLIWRSLKAPAYRNRWGERFALYSKKFPQSVIWFHAVSVGEVEALLPLVKQIQHQYPRIPLLITTTTPTGSARVRVVMQESVEHVYLPYDLPGAIHRFMQCFKPKMAVIMETEIWPNLFAHCSHDDIPLYIINARLSEKSASGYRKIPALISPALACVKVIAAQTQDDARRFIAIGAREETVKTLGNIKFDVEVAEEIIDRGLQLKAELFNGRFVWLIASTHKDEEAIFLDIYKEIKQEIPELLLVIVPRHPERFSEVKKLCEQKQLAVVMRTAKDSCRQYVDVYLADTMGELKMLYAASDLAFVGGSMVPVGGHNILEAAAVGAPVLFGPYMTNFKEIAEGALRQGAAIQCQNKSEIIDAINVLYADSMFRRSLAEKGKAFIRQNQGAIARVLGLLSQDI